MLWVITFCFMMPKLGLYERPPWKISHLFSLFSSPEISASLCLSPPPHPHPLRSFCMSLMVPFRYPNSPSLCVFLSLPPPFSLSPPPPISVSLTVPFRYPKSVCLPACLFACLPACLSVSVSACLSVCLCVESILRELHCDR